MKLHYVYYAPDFIQVDGTKGKVGCTRWLKKRMRNQKITNYEILETHEDKFIAAKRELELQVKYNCVEKHVGIDYVKTLKWSEASKVNKKGYKKTKQHCNNISIAKTGVKDSLERRLQKKQVAWKTGTTNGRQWSTEKKVINHRKLTEEQVKYIRKVKDIKFSREVADEFKVAKATILNIWNDKTYRWVK